LPHQLDRISIGDLIKAEIAVFGRGPQVRIGWLGRPEIRWRILDVEVDRHVRNQAPSVSERQQAALVIGDLDHRQPHLAS
jgi:hypothetical protein